LYLTKQHLEHNYNIPQEKIKENKIKNNMKYSITIPTLLLLAQQSCHGFAPQSSFTSFSLQSNDFATANMRYVTSSSSSSRNSRRNQRTEMKMMFDQLASAISDVAKNIGGRSR
jgi:hypothetical protein